MTATVPNAESWNASIDKASWRALAASWMGWMFDGYESYALVLVMALAVRELLPPDKLPKASVYIGGLLAVTLIGWAAGGIAAGVLADYIGRRRTLMLSILWYAVFAGLTALFLELLVLPSLPLRYRVGVRRRMGSRHRHSG